MKTLDLILIILLIVGGFRGYKKGLIIEVIGIAAFVAGLIGAIKLMQWGIDFLHARFDLSGKLIPIVAFLGLFIIIVILVSIAGRFLRNVIHLTLLGAVDSLAGALLGVVKWAFGLSVLIWFFGLIGFSFPEEMSENTFLYNRIEGFAPRVIGWLSSVFPFVDDFLQSLINYIKS